MCSLKHTFFVRASAWPKRQSEIVHTKTPQSSTSDCYLVLALEPSMKDNDQSLMRGI
jgi:hypothetical protein